MRTVLRLYEALASLKLAVVLIGVAAIVLGWATFVESEYGTRAVHFGIYGTWWFAALAALLGVNVLAAALIRYPWKRFETGFVIIHAGILVLLVGMLVSRLGGIDAQLPVFEGQTEHVAYEDSQHFALSVYGVGSGKAKGSGDAAKAEDLKSERVIDVPFVAGPFNWRDYARLGLFPWGLCHRDRGVLYDEGGIRLEVLDYLSNCTYGEVPPLALKVKGKGAAGAPEKGESDGWEEIELGVRWRDDPHAAHGGMSLGSRKKLAGGERIVFWTANSMAATEAFLQSRPEGPLGTKGLVVLYADGKRYQFSVDKLLAEKAVPIGDTGLTLEAVRLDEQFFGLVLLVHCAGEPDQRMVLFADVPEFNQQDEEHGVYGTYWVDVAKLPEVDSATESDKSMRQSALQPRIDIVEGADKKLYYRTWKSPKFGAEGQLPVDEPVKLLASSEDPVTVWVTRFVASDKPGKRLVAGPLGRAGSRRQVPEALVRLTVDGRSEEFWLQGAPSGPQQELRADQRKVVAGKGRRVAVTLRHDWIDVGFGLTLREFQRRLDPGSSQASWYASLVDMVDRNDPQKKLKEEVLITLNEPVNFTDPSTGRSYRVYQESFAGPFKPGDPDDPEQTFEKVVGGQSQRNELFLSWLTFNYDPGRGLKYFGCLLIVVGLSVVFYMRAYFFRRRGSVEGMNGRGDEGVG